MGGKGDEERRKLAKRGIYRVECKVQRYLERLAKEFGWRQNDETDVIGVVELKNIYSYIKEFKWRETGCTGARWSIVLKYEFCELYAAQN